MHSMTNPVTHMIRKTARASDYVELRCKSAFSFLEGASQPERLVQRAVSLGYDSLALADRDGLYAVPRFYEAAREADLRCIFGSELTLLEDGQACHFLALVENEKGYANLSRLITQGRARAPKGYSQLHWDELEEQCTGLIFLLHADASFKESTLLRLRDIAGPEQLWVDVCRHRERGPDRMSVQATQLAEAHGIPIVATNDVHMSHPSERKLQDVFTCLRWKTTLARAGRLLQANSERYLKSPEEMVRLFADRPQWIQASREIAERCRFDLADLNYAFPTFPAAVRKAEEAQLPQDVLLARHTWAGARQRYGRILPARVMEQLQHELDLIAKLKLVGYFLIVHDIVCFAQREGMLAQGRGSAANSAVCYSLGITAVDPIGMELLFERFLSEERGEWPDIDIDLPSGARREKVIQYVFDKYGERGAAMTANVITYRSRSALREVGKVLDLPPEQLEQVSKQLAGVDDHSDTAEVHEALAQGGIDATAPSMVLLLELSAQLRGLPRHLGQHSGGVVIAAGHLDEIVPIEPASMQGRRVIQWDKEDCCDRGMIKIDLLGLGMLKALEETLPLIERFEGKNVDLANLPPDDPKTFALIQRADTVGTFQIESRAQMAVLPRLRPERFYDLVVQVAIIRPGPIQGKMVHPYLQRRAGREPVHYPHPCLEPILKRTLGVPLFQEQLLRIAMAAADFTGGEAEELRRAMGFRRSNDKTDKMERLAKKLQSGMQAKGIEQDAQEEILRGILSFALYGFPESHAASFALIAYASAYLKAHHPAAFLAGLLNAAPLGFYSKATLIKDFQRHGVTVLPIDVASSSCKTSLEWMSEQEDAPGKTTRKPKLAVRLGLRLVHGLRRETSEAIEQASKENPFADVGDLARRVHFFGDELETLAELGALRGIDPRTAQRRAALWQIAAMDKEADSLFRGMLPCETDNSEDEKEIPSLAERSLQSPVEELSALEETLADYQASGVTTGPHVMAYLRPELDQRGILSAASLRHMPHGSVVHSAGHVIVRQRPQTANGFCFLTLEDETGTSNAVLTPQQFKRFRTVLQRSRLVELKGKLQNVDGVVHVYVLYVGELELEGVLPESHDYR